MVFEINLTGTLLLGKIQFSSKQEAPTLEVAREQAIASFKYKFGDDVTVE